MQKIGNSTFSLAKFSWKSRVRKQKGVDFEYLCEFFFSGNLCEDKNFCSKNPGNPGLNFTKKSLEIQPPLWGRVFCFWNSPLTITQINVISDMQSGYQSLIKLKALAIPKCNRDLVDYIPVFFLSGIISLIQGGSIKPLLKFGGRFYRIGIKLGTNLNRIIIYVILTILGENFIKNETCVAKIRIFVQNTQ